MSKPERECPHASSCPMYKLLSASGTLGAWKGRYCLAAFERCARYEMASAGRPVPINLLPDGQLLKRPRR